MEEKKTKIRTKKRRISFCTVLCYLLALIIWLKLLYSVYSGGSMLDACVIFFSFVCLLNQVDTIPFTLSLDVQINFWNGVDETLKLFTEWWCFRVVFFCLNSKYSTQVWICASSAHKLLVKFMFLFPCFTVAMSFLLLWLFPTNFVLFLLYLRHSILFSMAFFQMKM